MSIGREDEEGNYNCCDLSSSNLIYSEMNCKIFFKKWNTERHPYEEDIITNCVLLSKIIQE